MLFFGTMRSPIVSASAIGTTLRGFLRRFFRLDLAGGVVGAGHRRRRRLRVMDLFLYLSAGNAPAPGRLCGYQYQGITSEAPPELLPEYLG
jgi:hypothetical protein